MFLCQRRPWGQDFPTGCNIAREFGLGCLIVLCFTLPPISAVLIPVGSTCLCVSCSHHPPNLGHPDCLSVQPLQHPSQDSLQMWGHIFPVGMQTSEFLCCSHYCLQVNFKYAKFCFPGWCKKRLFLYNNIAYTGLSAFQHLSNGNATFVLYSCNSTKLKSQEWGCAGWHALLVFTTKHMPWTIEYSRSLTQVASLGNSFFKILSSHFILYHNFHMQKAGQMLNGFMYVHYKISLQHEFYILKVEWNRRTLE